MTCAYSQSGNSKCQFENHYYSYVLVDGERWCQFHAPLEDKYGNPTHKRKWIPDEIKGFYKGISELRESSVTKQEKLDLSGVVFPSDANFLGQEFPEVDFSNARFEGRANFHDASFNGAVASFHNTHFCADITFEGAKFSDSFADFRGAEFSETASFIRTQFKKGANFLGARFNRDTTFCEAKFIEARVDFSGAEFLGVDFSQVTFNNKDTYFRDTQFNGRADFRGTQFDENVIFQNARFIGGEAIFWDAKFQENADFSHTKFIGGDAWFNRAVFDGQNANFSHAEFSDRRAAQFPEVIFNSSAIFVNTRFSDWGAHFSNAKFNGGYADFQNARFKGDATFINARFRSDRIEFQGSCIKGRADFTSPGNDEDGDAFHGEADFSGAELQGEVSFNNRKFQQSTNFRKCTFHKAPRFHNCRLHQETDFTDARFLDTSSTGSAMAYRTLKQDMEEKRARQEQLVFYALEMKCRRSEEKRKFLKFISWLYEATSDYGQRIILPLAWLAFFFLLFTLIYAAYFKGLLNLDAGSILPQSLHFSIRQIIRPFGVFASSSLSEFFGETPSANLLALPLIIAATLQSLFSLLLLLLSALAARWRFKIG